MKKVQNYYNSISEGYDNLYLKEQIRKLNLVKKFIKGTILDVGSGTCFINKNFKNVDSIDISLLLLKKGKGIRLLANGEFLPFKNHSYDTVISLTVLQDLKNHEKFIKECERVGKRIIISCLKRKRTKTWFLKLFELKGKLIEEEKDWIFISD